MKPRSIVSSIETLGEHKRFLFSRNLVAPCNKLSHINSQIFALDFIWDCCRLLGAEKFLRNPGQFK